MEQRLAPLRRRASSWTRIHQGSPQINLNRLIAELGLSEGTETLAREWDASQRSMPAGHIPFLTPDFIADACEGVSVSDQVCEMALTTAQRIAQHPALRALAWHCHHCLFRAEDYPRDNIAVWPTLEATLGDDTGMFHVLVLLSGVPGMREIHAAHCVPADIIRDTCSQIQVRLEAYREEHGVWGMVPHYVSWFMNHLTGKLYRLVRLQFQFGSFGYKLRAFRQRASGTLVVLSEAGVRYRADGQLCRDGDDDAETWAADLLITDDEITGNPILPTGAALRRKVTLPAAEWRQVLAPGDPILNIHIPGGEPLDFDRCGESLRAVPEFFGRHYPERPFAGICCGSWILNSAIQELLPPTSNLVRFQREVYLFPIGLHESSLPHAIFHRVPEDLSKAPRDTCFQRAYLDRELGGEPVVAGGGGCLFFPEDMDWASQVYLNQEFPW